jgi:hypothetical protein
MNLVSSGVAGLIWSCNSFFFFFWKISITCFIYKYLFSFVEHNNSTKIYYITKELQLQMRPATPDETKFIFRSLDFPTKIWAKIFTPCSEKYMTPPPVLF